MSETESLIPTAIVGKVLFESGVTVKNAQRMVDINSRIEGDGNQELVAYFTYEIESLMLYASQAEKAASNCRICDEDSIIRIQGVGLKCANCGAWY